MDDRSLLRFISAAALVMLLWFFVAPWLGLMPNKPAAKQQDPNAQKIAQSEEKDKESPEADASSEEETKADDSTAKADGEAEPEVVAEKQPESEQNEVAQFPHRNLVLGTLDENAPYYLKVDLTTAGASVEGAWLNDPRFKQVEDTDEALCILGANPAITRNSFEFSSEEVDALLAKQNTSLTEVDWKVVKEVKDEKLDILTEVVFQYPAPDNSVVLEKRFWLEPVSAQNGQEPASRLVRDTHPEGYLLHLEVKIHNQQQKVESVDYRMLGPVGIPLENPISTYKWRDIKFQSETAQDDFEGSTVTAKEIVKDSPGPWTNYLQFIGVDVQYFATLVFPDDKRPFADRYDDRWLKQVEPIVLDPNQNKPQFSDISFMLISNEERLNAGEDLVHQYNIYLGPKRDDLMEPMNAEYVMEVWSWISWLSKPMMWLLTWLHDSVGFPYWLAIICLTIMVRGTLHPITRRQMASAKRMKELQPKLQELKKKHGNDREKLAQAQMQLYRDHNFNPLAGCLPVLMQMPIFIALYQGLRSTIDLRLAKFLWIDDLSAPDMLLTTGFQNFPLLGDYFYYFNLLPVLTVGLFIVQNKILMPQPDPNDEMAVQTQRMMKYMMVMMGFMFYHVPSGLCLYFITSSIWSLCERKLIDFQHDSKPKEVLEESPSTIRPQDKKQTSYTRNGDQKTEKEPGKVGGLWNRILAAAEAQQQLQRENDKAGNQGSFPGKKKKKKR